MPALPSDVLLAMRYLAVDRPILVPTYDRCDEYLRLIRCLVCSLGASFRLVPVAD